MASIHSPENEPSEPPRLRNLRWLVTILTATMILGLLTIIALVVITLTRVSPGAALPAHITIPVGETTLAFTQGSDWIALVTKDRQGSERIRILDSATGKERQTIDIALQP